MAQRRRRWRIRLSQPAEHDFLAILQWTAEQFGRRQASLHSQTLSAAVTALSDDPFVPDSHARDEIQPGLRSLHIARNQRRGRHLILYRPEFCRILATQMPRRKPLFFGRNEECGLRCVDHGWKFDVNGSCVDMPGEPAGATSRTR